MRKNMVLIVATAAVAAGTPVQAQSIVDSFKSLKSSFKALTNKPAASPEAENAAQQVDQLPANQDGADIVSVAELVDDPSDSALENAALVRRQVATFDVLGFRLGMTPREFSRVAKKRKIYRAQTPSFSGSLEVEAARLANEKLNRPVTKRSKFNLVRAYGVTKDKGQINVDFALEQTGPKLSKLWYSLKTNGQTKAQIEASLIAKYGPFDRAQNDALYWCASMKGCQFVENEDRLRVWIGDSDMSIELYRSSGYENRTKAALVARSNQIAAQAGKPVAF
jgi:hypothetical protein